MRLLHISITGLGSPPETFHVDLRRQVDSTWFPQSSQDSIQGLNGCQGRLRVILRSYSPTRHGHRTGHAGEDVGEVGQLLYTDAADFRDLGHVYLVVQCERGGTRPASRIRTE